MIITRDKNFYKSLILLAIPMVLQNLITFSVGLADNIMIGSLGDSAVSGVYMGNQVQTVLQVLSTGIEGGLLLLSAQYWGKGDKDAVRRIIAIGLRFCLILGTVFTAVCAIAPSFVIKIFTDEVAVIESGTEYLSILAYSFIFFCLTQALIVSMRSVEVARIGLWVSLTSLFINIGLNYLLIFGKMGFPILGIKGAAIATLTSRICEAVIMVVYVALVDKRLQLRLSHLLITDKALLRDYIRYGTPILMGQLVWGANLIANSMILGRFTESVITATSLANTVSSLMYVSLNGLSGAVGIIISKTVGSGDISRIKEYSRTTEIIFLTLGILTGAGFAILRAPFIGLFNISAEAAMYSSHFITVLCFTGIGTCYECGCLFGLVKSGGDVSFVFKNDTIFVFLVVIPSAIITAYLGLAPWIVYLCLKSDQILKCVVAFFKIRRYDWMKNLTRKY